MSVWSAKKIITKNGVYENCELILNNNIVTEFKKISDPKFEIIAPMLFDIHINGGYQFHFTSNPNETTVRDIDIASSEHGTWCTLPTIITSPPQNMIKGIKAVKKYISENPQSGVKGIHLEGPFLNIKKKGAHLEKYIVKPNKQLIDSFLEQGTDIIKMWTIAPEVFDEKTLDYLLETKLNISLGHSDATYEEAVNAIQKGSRLATHLYNAMSPLSHRAPGLTGAALTNNNLWNQIILDGHHCHFAAAGIALRQKPEKTILVSDALFLGRKKETFQWENFEASWRDGTYYNSAGTLAGAAISQLDAVKYAVNVVGISDVEAVKMSAINPYVALQIPDDQWDIKMGSKAPFIAFDTSFNFVYKN
jgi:N-acetylglucosamine-6-phosphate deacetylase